MNSNSKAILQTFSTNQAEYIISELNIKNDKIHAPRFHRWSIDNALIYIHKHIQKEIPLSKIFKEKHFWNDLFHTGRHVLDPRQETEIIVEQCIEHIKKYKLKSMLDLGTGSGCIAISIKKEIPEIECTAVDISKKALNIAKYNEFKILHSNSQQSFIKHSKNNNSKINFIQSNWFQDIVETKYDLIVSNPPYIASTDVDVDISAAFDPDLALYAEQNGLKNYIDILQKGHEFLHNEGFLIFEIGYDQAHVIKKIPSKFKYIKTVKDYTNNNRCVIFQKPVILP